MELASKIPWVLAIFTCGCASPATNPPRHPAIRAVSRAAARAHGWIRIARGDGFNAVADAAVSGKNLLVLAEFQREIDFGCGPLRASGRSEIALVSLHQSDGSCDWSIGFGGSGRDKAGSMWIGGDGAVIVTAELTTSATVGKGAGPLPSGLYALSFDQRGQLRWISAIPGQVWPAGPGFATGDPSGDVYVASTSGPQGQLTWIDHAGHLVSVMPLVATASGKAERISALTRGVDGHCLAAGIAFSHASLVPRIQSTRSEDAFVTSVDCRTGQRLWTQTLSSSAASIRALEVRGDHVLVGAMFRGSGIVNGQRSTSRGGWDLVLTELALTDGSVVSFRQIGGIGEDYLSDLVASPAELYLSAEADGPIDFGGGRLVGNPGKRAAELVRLVGGGRVILARALPRGGAPMSWSWRRLAATGEGDVFVAGTARGPIVWDHNRFDTRGPSSLYVLRLNRDELQ